MCHYGNCLHQKVDPSWEVRLVGIELHPGYKGISGYCYHYWILGAIFMGCVDACLKKKKGRFLGEAGAGYLPSGSNKVKVSRWWSGLLVNCCVWVLIVGSVCVEICRSWAHWESRVRCEGSCGRNLTAREPQWKQNGLPSMVDIMQMVLTKSHRARGASHQSAFVGVCLTISHTCLPCLPSRWPSPCVLWFKFDGEYMQFYEMGMEFKDKIMLHCLWGVISQQGFTPRIRY